MSNLMKIRPVGAELFNADGRADRYDDANCRLRTRPETYYSNQVKIFFPKIKELPQNSTRQKGDVKLVPI